MKDLISPFNVELTKNKDERWFILCLLEHAPDESQLFPNVLEHFCLCREDAPLSAFLKTFKHLECLNIFGLTHLEEIDYPFNSGETILSRYTPQKIDKHYWGPNHKENTVIYCETTRVGSPSKGYLDNYISFKNEDTSLKAKILQKNMTFVTSIDDSVKTTRLFSQKHLNSCPKFISPNDLLSSLIQKPRHNFSEKEVQQELPLQYMTSGIFENNQPTFYKGQNLDIPTWMRKGITLDIGE